MLSSLRRFLGDLAGQNEEPLVFGDDDYRLAAAALLVHLIAVDGTVNDAERDRLRDVLAERFDLDVDEAADLMTAAVAKDRESVDIYGFTSILNRALDEEGRRRIVEMMWEVVYADGAVHEFEDNIVWRAADLLHVPARDRLALKRAVAGSAADEE